MKTTDFMCIILFLLFGYEFTKTDFVQNNLHKFENPGYNVVGAESVNQTIVDSMKSVSKDDAGKIYTIFSGLSLYIEQTKKIDSTLKMFQLVSEMELDFNYQKGVYKDFTDAVEKFLVDKNYKKAKNIVDIVNDNTKEITRSDVVNDLRTIANAAKVVRDGK